MLRTRCATILLMKFHIHRQINPKENLPQQICDLCIVQLNVSYNFKRLAVKNDFQIRQYMIENGMSLSKDDDDMETTTALEIHQIHHNVIRTNRYRQIAAPEIRRNSTTSSVSGTSTMIINGRESDVTMNNSTNNFVQPRPMVRPIQIKVEPADPDEEPKAPSPVTSSPSNASEPTSVVTVCSSKLSSEKVLPMITINGVVNDECYAIRSTPAPLSVKLSRNSKSTKPDVTKSHNLRVIKKKTDEKSKKWLRKVAEITVRASTRNSTKKEPRAKKANFRIVSKDSAKGVQPPKKRGRPRKLPGDQKTTNKRKGETKS